MKQYLELLKHVKENGLITKPSRENMPYTKEVFGYQFRHNLQYGFPLLTTKNVNFKNIVTELLWFLRGDTNIKYLVDNGCNIWNEDAYNFFCKKFPSIAPHKTMEQFIGDTILGVKLSDSYVFGDCGFQYGKVWRDWQGSSYLERSGNFLATPKIDQIKNIIISLRDNPQSRRHILTSIDPKHENELALFWCHALTQFNCRELTLEERYDIFMSDFNLPHFEIPPNEWPNEEFAINYKMKHFDSCNIPKYYLDCQMYQRSADLFLGVPYNIGSYALLTHIFCEILNMVPGEMIYSYGSAHIYENHFEQVDLQLSRIPSKLPKLNIKCNLKSGFENYGLDDMLNSIDASSFEIHDYNPQSAIKGKLSTGLK